jgi:hypothetical protein
MTKKKRRQDAKVGDEEEVDGDSISRTGGEVFDRDSPPR